MNLASILQQCRMLGISMQAKDDRLQIHAPKGTVSDELLSNIRELKYSIIHHLQTTESTCSTRSSYSSVQGDQVDRKPDQQVDQTHTPEKDDQVEAFEERAAIMEYDGGLSRAAAETAAQGICMARFAKGMV